MNEALDDLRSHLVNWQRALTIAKEHAERSLPDIDDKLYWQHERVVLDRTIESLLSTAKKTIQERIEVLEQFFSPTCPGTIIQRSLKLNASGTDWTIGFGTMGAPKRYFTASLLEDAVRAAEVFVEEQQAMFERTFERPRNYFKLSAQKQHEIDKMLGILNWEGYIPSTEDRKRFNEHNGYNPR